jgi:hypothetical protein
VQAEQLGAQEFSYDGTDHSQTEDGNGTVVLLQGDSYVSVLGVHVGSPAEASEDAERSQGPQ